MRIRNAFFAAVLAVTCWLSPSAIAQTTSLAVNPVGAVINAQTQQQFTVSEDFVNSPNGVWSVDPTCGTISQQGLYSAPDAHSVAADETCLVKFTNSLTGQIVSAGVRVIATYDATAELPINKVNSSMAATPAPGAVTLVTIASQLQTVITNAKCGDTIELLPTVAYSGAFKLPAKGCDNQHWVVIRTSSADSLLPPEGTRITPCYAGVASLPGRPALNCASTQKVMATITTPNGGAPFTLASNAGHYRLGPGLEITRLAKTGLVFGMITGSGGATGAGDHLIVDRDWVHGTAQDETTRGIMLSGLTYVGIVDSYLNDFHCATNGKCADSQAIAGGTGPLAQGTWKIDNNFLEAASENILTGGVLSNSATPTDIEITRNHMFKPLIWMPGQPGYVGAPASATQICPRFVPTGTVGQCPFSVKNLLEFKNADRVRVEGNVMEDSWPGFSQHGGTILISGLNPPALAGQPVYSTTSVTNVTIRYNRVHSSTSGFNVANMAGQGDGAPVVAPNLPNYDISIHDDIFDDIDVAYLGPDGPNYTDENLIGVSSCDICTPEHGITVNHITMLAKTIRGAFVLGVAGTQTLGFTFTNSILTTAPGVTVTSPSGSGCGSTGSTPLARITACLTTLANFQGNVLIGATLTWPTNNAKPGTPALVGFTNFNNGAGGDYTLLATSPYKGTGLDGKDPGANVTAVMAATAGVE